MPFGYQQVVIRARAVVSLEDLILEAVVVTYFFRRLSYLVLGVISIYQYLLSIHPVSRLD